MIANARFRCGVFDYPFGMDLQREREVVAALDQIAATGLRGAPKGEPKFN